MIRILLSDDNSAFRQSSREQGAAMEVEVVPFEDWESAQAELDEHFDLFHGVVIDGKGKLRDTTKGEDGKHLLACIKWFSEQKAKGRYIPVVVFTGFYDEIEAFTETDSQILRVFDKSKNSFLEVVDFLKKEIRNTPKGKLKSKYPVVHDYSLKYFSPENRQIILSILENLNSGKQDFIWKKNLLDGLRRLNESLVDTIPQHFYEPEFEIRDFIEKIRREGNPRASIGNRAIAIIEYFHHNKMQVPGPVLNTIKNIYFTASTFAAHSDEQQTDYFPSTEMILGLVYSHFGCYHWFNQIIKN